MCPLDGELPGMVAALDVPEPPVKAATPVKFKIGLSASVESPQASCPWSRDTTFESQAESIEFERAISAEAHEAHEARRWVSFRSGGSKGPPAAANAFAADAQVLSHEQEEEEEQQHQLEDQEEFRIAGHFAAVMESAREEDDSACSEDASPRMRSMSKEDSVSSGDDPSRMGSRPSQLSACTENAPWSTPKLDDSGEAQLEARLEARLGQDPLSPMSFGSVSHIEAWNEPSETLIILDWDDTLCPTTHDYQHPGFAEHDRVALESHTKAVESLLRIAKSLGHVTIVSMAGKGWIEETTKRLMPALWPVLEELDISVALAREGVPYTQKRQAFAEARDPSCFLKRRMMKRVIKNFYRLPFGRRSCVKPKERSWKNILSVGDSMAERFALQDLVLARKQCDSKGNWKECRGKTVKLKTEPSLSELSAQITTLTNWLPAMVFHDGDLDFDVDADGEVHEIERPCSPSSPKGPWAKASSLASAASSAVRRTASSTSGSISVALFSASRVASPPADEGLALDRCSTTACASSPSAGEGPFYAEPMDIAGL